MAKLLQHPNDGTYYTTRYVDGVVTRQIHPDGVILLKRHGVRIGEDIPPFSMVELVERGWLYTVEDAARQDEVDWSPEWDAIGHPPALSTDWIRGSTEWSRLQPFSAHAITIGNPQSGFRWPTVVGTAILVVMIAGAFLL